MVFGLETDDERKAAEGEPFEVRRWHGASCGAHFLERALAAQGHDVRLMPLQYVKTNTNDYRDAEGNAEAALRLSALCPCSISRRFTAGASARSYAARP